MIIDKIDKRSFKGKFSGFDGIIDYNGVIYNNQKKIYEEIKDDSKFEIPKFLNVPNKFLYNLLVYMLFFEKYEI